MRMRVRPDRVLGRWYRVQREQWLRPAELEHLQWSRFMRVLRHAAAHSPFYRRKFRSVGLTPEDIRDPADLALIPVTSREELRSSEDFIVDGCRKESLYHSFSSGSTGQSVKTYFGPDAWLLGRFLLKLRARIACGVRPWDRLALFQAGALENSRLRRYLLRQASFSIHEPLEDVVRRLRRMAPTVLYGFPNHFRRLAELPRAGILPKRIFTSGEMMTAETRRAIEAHFDAPVYDVYGCTELKEIAWECPERRGHHINSDWLLVESLPATARGDPEGMMVITSLYNYAMPLIRYRLGDTGRLLNGLCACGRGLPLMDPRFGRSMDYFCLADGRLVSPYALSSELERLHTVRQFQIVQSAYDRVVVNVVPDQGFGAQARDAIRAALGALLPGVVLDIREVDSIPRETSGKYRKVLSLLANARAPNP
jgi:phenylacetate-CoA ligase